MGTFTRRISSPFGRIVSISPSPMGSGSIAVCRSPSAMPCIRFSSSIRRSSIARGVPFSRAAAISPAFASNIFAAFSSSASAIARSAASFTADDVTASRREASFAARACSRTISSIVLLMQNPSENQKRKTASTVFLIIAHRARFVNFFARRARFPFPSDKNPRRQVHTDGDYLIRKEI